MSCNTLILSLQHLCQRIFLTASSLSWYFESVFVFHNNNCMRASTSQLHVPISLQMAQRSWSRTKKLVFNSAKTLNIVPFEPYGYKIIYIQDPICLVQFATRAGNLCITLFYPLTARVTYNFVVLSQNNSWATHFGAFENNQGFFKHS